MRYLTLLPFLVLACTEPTQRYIIIQNSGDPVLVQKLQTFDHLFQGFTADLTETQLKRFKSRTDLTLIPDQEFQIQMLPTVPGVNPEPTPALQRINRGLVCTTDGQGAEVGILDTGISSHQDLRNRIKGGKACIEGTGFEDDHGHGTHVSGIVNSVAPAAQLWSIKSVSFDGRGTWSSVLCGMEFAASNSPDMGGNLTVLNVSLGGLYAGPQTCNIQTIPVKDLSPILVAACKLKDLGVTVVVSAGNNAGPTAGTQPAAFNEAVITVSSISDSDGLPGGLGPDITVPWKENEKDDSFSSFTNYGPEVDIAAPGRHILSAWLGDGYRIESGTSMSAPFVSGAAALYISTHPKARWLEVRTALQRSGTFDWDKSQNHLEPILNIDPDWTRHSVHLCRDKYINDIQILR